jgi:antitoxin component of MazEF toxin-antitoxin module
MIKKLSKFGNSLALIIDKPILELFDIDATTELQIKADGKSLVITPVIKGLKRYKTISKNKKTQKAFEETIDQYKTTLKKLAKN